MNCNTDGSRGNIVKLPVPDRTTQPHLYVGIDPGMWMGALCVMSETAVVAAAAWKQLQRVGGNVWQVTFHSSDLELDTTIQPSYWAALDVMWACIPLGLPYHLAVEGLFLTSKHSQGIDKLFESAGGALAVWGPAAVSIERPRPSKWRPAILGIPGKTRAKLAKQAAIEWAKGHSLGRLTGNEHVAEATAMAAWMRQTSSALSQWPTQTTHTPPVDPW